MIRWSAVVGAALVAACGLVLLTPQLVSAHAGLESSMPAPSSVLETSPPLISLDFDEDIDVPLTSIELFDQSGARIALGTPTSGADGSIVQAQVPPLADATYAVVWRVSSADGHVVSGAFSFQVGTTGGTVDTGDLINSLLDDARADPAVRRSLGVSRFEAFAGASVLLGGMFMVWRTRRSAHISFGARQLLWIGWALLMLGTLANFGLLGANAKAGSVGDMLDTSLWGDIAATRTGGLLLVRAGLGLLFVAVLLTLDHRTGRWWQVATGVFALATVLTFSGAGHPSVQANAAVWIGVDALHFGGVVLWMGSLAMMTVGGRAWLRDDDHVVAVRSFSAMATVVVPLVVVTGVAQAWRLGGGLSALTDTTWGRILLVKGCVVVVLATLGAGLALGVAQRRGRGHSPHRRCRGSSRRPRARAGRCARRGATSAGEHWAGLFGVAGAGGRDRRRRRHPRQGRQQRRPPRGHSAGRQPRSDRRSGGAHELA